MHRKDLQHIVDKRFAALQSHWQGLHNLDENAIHDWRVEIKKMRALVRLFKKSDKKASIPASWKNVYDTAGEVRDRHLHLQLINNVFNNQVNEISTYIQLIEQEKNTASQQLVDLTNNDVILHMYFQNITTAIPAKLSIEKIKDHIRELLEQARNILWLTYKKDEYLHECRKHLKDAQYLYNAFEAELIENPIPNIPEFAKIEEGGKLLGEFQDQCTTLKFLGTSYINRLPASEKESIKEKKTDILKEKNRSKSRIILQLEELFNDFLHLHAS